MNEPHASAPLRRRQLACVWIAIGVLALAGAPAIAQEWRLSELRPAFPTWRDQVTVTVTGTVPGGCGASIGTPTIVPGTIGLPVSLDCFLPVGGGHPFESDVVIGPLDPGHYDLRLGIGDPAPELSFDVYEVGTRALMIPVLEVPALSTDAAPGALKVTTLGAARPSVEVAVAGRLIDVVLTEPLARPTQLFEVEVPLPPLAPGDYTVRVFSPHPESLPALVQSALRVWDDAGCLPDDRTLCLHGGRFRVTGTWRDFSERTGEAHPLTLADNDTSGLLWFFGPDNAEIHLKILDACNYVGRWWVFVSSGSTVEYEITVTDTTDGATRRYRNELGQIASLVADTGAYLCGG